MSNNDNFFLFQKDWKKMMTQFWRCGLWEHIKNITANLGQYPWPFCSRKRLLSPVLLKKSYLTTWRFLDYKAKSIHQGLFYKTSFLYTDILKCSCSKLHLCEGFHFSRVPVLLPAPLLKNEQIQKYFSTFSTIKVGKLFWTERLNGCCLKH